MWSWEAMERLLRMVIRCYLMMKELNGRVFLKIDACQFDDYACFYGPFGHRFLVEISLFFKRVEWPMFEEHKEGLTVFENRLPAEYEQQQPALPKRGILHDDPCAKLRVSQEIET
jgi:hypothetical protein